MNALIDWMRLLMGLVAGATLGAVLGLGIDYSSSAASVMGGTVAVVAGLASTLFLRAWFPRREKPSASGGATLLLLLCCYLVVTRIVWVQLGPWELAAWLAGGLALTWLVFTGVAESALFSAFVLGGLIGAVGGVIAPILFRQAFLPLMVEVEGAPSMPLVYASLGLLGAFAGAFASVGGRLSGWGMHGLRDEFWRFDREGRIEGPPPEDV